jgi:hypothetical protein
LRGGDVTLDELIRMVTIALGSADVSACPIADADGSGTIPATYLRLLQRSVDGEHDERKANRGRRHQGRDEPVARPQSVPERSELRPHEASGHGLVVISK